LIPASSGKTTSHRLNRGGDRQLDAALWRIAMVRLATEPDTRAYLASRTAQGKTKPEAIRCIKRYIAREVFTAYPAKPSLDSRSIGYVRPAGALDKLSRSGIMRG